MRKILFTFIVILGVAFFTKSYAQNPFITTWKTDNPGETVTIPVNSPVGGYNYTVDWGDGTPATNHIGSSATHVYATAGTYTVSISGDFPALYQPGPKLLSVVQWGDIAWKSMEAAFMGASNLTFTATDVPDLSGVTSMARMFRSASNFNEDLSAWHVSSVQDMQGMFFSATSFNGDISGWTTSNVTNMSDMFQSAESFNRDLSNWNVSAVQNMQGMFFMAYSFNGDLTGWAPSNVTNMISMFESATSFDRDLGDWDITNVESMDGMLKSSGLSTANYDATLIGWAAQGNIPQGIQLGAEGLTYCAGTDARQSLIDNYNWTINDAGVAADCTSGGGNVTPGDPANFVTTWKTDNDGFSDDNQILIPATGDFNYLWENVAIPAETGSGSGSGPTTITFPQAGTYKLSIQPTGSTPFHNIAFYSTSSDDKFKILAVNNWGTIPWSRFIFNGCANLKISATDIPNLSGVTNLEFAFSYSGVESIPNINDWDMSTITKLSSFLQQVTGFNQSLSNWDVSKVTDMSFMFDGATSFNQPLDSWDVSSLEQFEYMFRNATSFNQSLGAWNLASLGGGVGVFFNSGLSCENYSYTLYGWATNPNTNEGVLFNPWAPMEYSPDVVPYRDFLINDLGWTEFYGDALGTCRITLPDLLTPDENNILYVDINVNTTATGYTGAGDSWPNAIPELADALKWAREQHDGGNPGWTDTDPLRIFVAVGTYLPLYSAADGQYTTDGDRDNSFVLVPNVQLYGGFDPAANITDLTHQRLIPEVGGQAPSGGTILSGDFTGNDNPGDFVNHTENTYHVLIASNGVETALLDGFTITGGNANSSSTISVNGEDFNRAYGGGMYNFKASPAISNATFYMNSATYGGGMCNNNQSSPTISSVTFSVNSATSNVGAMFNLIQSSPVITNALFSGNSATGVGGAMANAGKCSPVITNTTFTGNSTTSQAGGMYNEDSSPIITNATFSGNSAAQGGGMYNISNATPTLQNSIIYGNSSAIYGTGTTITNSLVQGMGGGTDGNLDGTDATLTVEAVFVAPLTTPAPFTGGDYRLIAGSPAIDVGSNAAYTVVPGTDINTDLDLAGNPRLYNTTIDMGAYEFQVGLGAMQISVITPAGETITLDVYPSDAIQQVKQKIEDQKNIPSAQQRLVFDGKELTDGLTLADYSIVDGSKLYLWLPIAPSTVGILYVDKNVDVTATGYTGAGDTWTNAIPELHDALDYAHANTASWTPSDPLQIWVAKGLYKPTASTTDRTKYFNLLSNVGIYGGFTGSETAIGQRDIGANITVLSGDIGGDDDSDVNGVLDDPSKIHGNNSFHVVDGSGTNRTAILNGFTITAGQANVGPTTTDKGGGIFMETGSPRLEQLIISGNTAVYGGGLNVLFNSSPMLKYLIIRGNTASSEGGGLGHFGGSLLVNNTAIYSNSAQRGGGIHMNTTSSMTLANVTVSDNRADNGGGIYVFAANNGPVKLVNSILWGNTATSDGNEFTNYDYGGLTVVTLNNSLYRNRPGETDISIVGASVSFEPDAFSLNTSPRYISTDPTQIGYLQLDATSPAINAGNNQLYTDAGGDLVNDKDMAGNPRLFGSTIDMGTYEYQGDGVAVITPDADNTLYVDINVNTTATDYNGAGDSWTNAIPELADALKWAREQHDGGNPDWSETEPLRIFVAKGEYKPLYNAADGQYSTDGGRDNSFVLVPNVQVYGGFDPPAGIESLQNERILPDMNSSGQGSILSGDFNGNDNVDNYDNHTEDAHHVTIASGDVGSALMDGFTVTGGYASGNTSGPSVMGRTVYRFFGGGTYIITSSPQFTNVLWSNNLGEWGGGLYNTVSLLTETSVPKLSKVVFYQNRAPGGGGGISNFGGSIDINQAIFANNGAGFIEDPTSSGPGGAINSGGVGTSLSVTNATFYRNWIVGVFTPHSSGGAIHVDRTTTQLNNVVIWDNEVAGDPADPSASISLATLGATVTVSNSLVAHSGGSANWNSAMGILDGGDNIDTDPVFVSITPGDAGYLQLAACSPAISVGDNQAYIDAGGNLANDLDLAGNPRVHQFTAAGVIDMGAYEYQGERVLIQSLTMPDAVQVPYGTALGDVADLPTTVAALLSDDTDVSIPLDGNLANWTLTGPAGGTYNGDVAGTYVFSVPVLIPESECFLNPENLQAEVTVVVAKGTPILTASWNGTLIDVDEGLSLTYGDSGELVFSTTDTDGELTYTFGNGDTPVLGLTDLSAIAAQQAGTATLIIAQEETDNYKTASIAFSVTVAPKAITIVPTVGQGKVYGAVEPTGYGYELAGGSTLALADVLTDLVSTSSRQAGEDVGAYDITLALDGEQAANYEITFTANNDAFIITPAEITGLALQNISSTYNGTEHVLALAGNLPVGTSVTYTIDDMPGNGATDAGSYAVKAVIDGGNNYESTTLTAILTITPLTITVTAADKTKVFGTTDPALTYSVVPTLIGSDEFTGSLMRAAGEPVGDYAIAQGDLTAGSNYGITFQAGTLTITRAAITGVGFDDLSTTYNGTEHVLALAGNLPTGASVTYTIDGKAGNGAVDADTYEVNAIIDGGDNYADATLTATLTIKPVEITVTAADKTKVFGANDPALTYGFTPVLIGGDAFTGALTRAVGESVGEYAITQGNLSLGTNYEIAFAAGALTITVADYEGIAFNDGSAVYDGTEHKLAITGTLPEGTSVTYENNSRTNAGTQTARANIDGGDNYKDLVLTAELTVTPATIDNIAFEDHRFIYNGSAHVLAISGDLPDGASVTYETNSRTNAGTQTAMANIDGGDNYGDLTLTAELTVTKAAITGITFTSKDFVYDGTAKSLSISGTLPDGASITYETNSRTVAGTQTATANIDGGNNYEDLTLTAELTVTKAAFSSITFDDQSFVYDGTAKSLSISGSLPDGASVTYTDNSLTEADGQTVTATIKEDNYEDLILTAKLTVTKATITGIAFGDKDFVYNGTAHIISISGTLPDGASVSYTGNSRTEAGTQTVTATIDGGKNYEDLVLTSALTVRSNQRSITFPAIANRTYGDGPFNLNAVSNSGEVVSYMSSNTAVAAVSAAGEVTIKGAGTATITATVPENSNYANRPSLSRTLVIAKANQRITFAEVGAVDRDAGSIPLEVTSSSGLPISLSLDDGQVAALDGSTLNILRLGTVRITATQAGDGNYNAAAPVAVEVRVVDAKDNLSIRVHPALSPNGDGINEFLMVEGIKEYAENRLIIMNRNGNKVTEIIGYNNADRVFRGVGPGNELLSSGTYYYLLEVKVDGVWKYRKGYFVIRY